VRNEKIIAVLRNIGATHMRGIVRTCRFAEEAASD
jgi:hypothetical protein